LFNHVPSAGRDRFSADMIDPIFHGEQGLAFGKALVSTQELSGHRKRFAKHAPRLPKHQRDPLRHADWSANSPGDGDDPEGCEAPTPVSRHWVKAAAEHWRPPPPLFEGSNCATEAHFLEALVTAPDNRLAWDAVRLVGMLSKQVQGLRDDIRRAPATYASSRRRADELALAEFSEERHTTVVVKRKSTIRGRFDDIEDDHASSDEEATDHCQGRGQLGF